MSQTTEAWAQDSRLAARAKADLGRSHHPSHETRAKHAMDPQT